MPFKFPPVLPLEPLSHNGVRLRRGDVVRLIKGGKRCHCKGCNRVFEQTQIRVARTQDEDPWLHARDCRGGGNPLIRLTRKEGDREGTGCCYRACELQFVSRDGCLDRPTDIEVVVQVNGNVRTLFQQKDESVDDFGSRVARLVSGLKD